MARCHEVQTCLGSKDVPEFDDLVIVGMAVRTAVLIRGLPLIEYEKLKLVCSHFLQIPTVALKRVVEILAEVDFVVLDQVGKTIKSVTPDVPYYDDLYSGLGEYLSIELTMSEPEWLTLTLVDRLAASPENVDSLRNSVGADGNLFARSVSMGNEGGYLYTRRYRGRDIAVNPSFFAENSHIFADHVAASGSTSVSTLLSALRENQGWPLGVIETTSHLGETPVVAGQVGLLRRLAEDGIIKPPTITAKGSGTNHFLFTPTPSPSHLAPSKRDVYEKAMAIVAAIRQGQLLPQKYAIRNPKAVLHKLKSDLRLSTPTTEFAHQYANLVHLRIGRLNPVGNGYAEFQIVPTEENKEALDMAYDLVTAGGVSGYEVDDDARRALQQDLQYVESLVASAQMRQREVVSISEEQQYELDNLFLGFGLGAA